ncbi:MAG: 30S ribosomal protein S12 methylthiotransferase RimO [Clostridia bacterium]|jgi:ribosomal protein S12 methylthiotransferase|nr:30S ribosomal protein S12 methylthiotransferase RimO [Clostridia bacterium]
MSYTVKIITLGCPKNQVDSRQIGGFLLQEGFVLTENTAEAQIIVVNTCGFIEEAKKESLESIFEMLQWKEKGVCRYLIAAGCLAQKYEKELSTEIPEIDAIIGTGDIPKLPEILNQLINKRSAAEKIVSVGSPNAFLYSNDVPEQPPETPYAYLKIAEGCDNACSYCVIPQMRGSYRSRKREDILSEAASMVRKGIKELILVAQDTTLYGYDLYGRLELPALLRELVKIPDLAWVRILYAYPNNITDDLLETIRTEEKICSYLDIPLQHISDNILMRMGRRITKEDTEEIIRKIRRSVPGIVLRSTFIIGFPGETKEDFNTLLNFLREAQFDRAGFFAYSREPDTRAAGFDNQVNRQILSRRLNKAVKLQKEILAVKQSDKIGQEVTVITDGPSADYAELWEGRTAGDAPEIDGLVYFKPGLGQRPGDFVRLKVTHSQDFALMGEIIA